MLKLIIGLIVGGLYLQFLTHFVGYDVPKWMLLEQVDDCEQYMYFYHQMFGLNSPKHNLICNAKLGILLEMLIYRKKLSLQSSKKRESLFGEGGSVTAIVTPYATLVRTE